MDASQGINISSSELDESTRDKLRGDAIGDTLYGESFVLKTLMQLSDLKWGPQIEEDLCFLWDMTVEKDVCKYLFDLEFPSLACSALAKYDEGRFIEIMIGILANVFSSNCQKHIKDAEIKAVLKELDTDDPLVLIQVNRFIIAIAYSFDEMPFITDYEISKLNFILDNSTNTELILKTLEAVSKITEDFKLQTALITVQLYNAVTTGVQTTFEVRESDFDFDEDETLVTVKLFLEIVANICSYNTKTSIDELISTINSCETFNKIVLRIVQYFSVEGNLFPISYKFGYSINSLSYILVNVDYNFDCNLLYLFCKILGLFQECKSENAEVFEAIVEIIGYFVHIGSVGSVLHELKKLKYARGIFVLNSLKENEKKLDFSISDKLKCLFKEYK